MKKVLMWIGRILITIVGFYYLFILILGLFDAPAEPIELEGLGVVTFGILTLISIVLAYVRPRIGAWTVLGVGIGFSIFALLTAGRYFLGAVMVSGGPLVIGGLLLIFSLPKALESQPE
jgi:hypothetical protein